MCIFSQPVVSVNNTQIFARATSRSTQFLVYQMNYESPNENAMILPIPIRQPADDQSLRFIDLGDYQNLFSDLMAGFPYSAPAFSIGCSSPPTVGALPDLKVYEVGNYIASFVPQSKDFERLDPRFTLPKSVWSQLPQYDDHGFAVFQLAAGSLKPHPMAFEFDRRGGSLYFPTLHIHDGEIHDVEEFDHVLYLQHAEFDSRVSGYQNSDVPDESTGLVRSKYAAKYFCNTDRSNGIVDADLLVHRRTLRGIHPNRDTVVPIMGDPEKVSLSLRSLSPHLPWLTITAAATWFFARRDAQRARTPAIGAEKGTREDRG